MLNNITWIFEKRKEKWHEQDPVEHVHHQENDSLEEIISRIRSCKLPFDTRIPPEGNITLRSTWSTSMSSWLPFQSVTWSDGVSLLNQKIERKNSQRLNLNYSKSTEIVTYRIHNVTLLMQGIKGTDWWWQVAATFKSLPKVQRNGL